MWIEQIQDIQFWINLMEQIQDLGPIVPILLPMLESLIPALPLIAIVIFNTTLYGFLWGFLYSYIGEVLGSYLVFMFFRTLIKGYLMKRYYHGNRIAKLLAWVEKQSPLFLFMVSAIPFTPSSLINISFGVSGYQKRQFFISVAAGKFISIGLMAYFGHSLSNVLDQPISLIISTVLIVLAYFLSQRFTHHSGLNKLD